MRATRVAIAFTLALFGGLTWGQEITPETPATFADETEEITVELGYVGASSALSDAITGQIYLAYGPDDEIELGVLDVARTINPAVRVGGRYQFFGSENGRTQHTFWAYLNAERFVSPSWRIDTRQVLEQRLDTSGVEERLRYRPRIRTSFFGDVGRARFQLYASIEPIFNWSDADDDQLSWAGGGFLRLSDRIQLNVFYQFTETDRGPDFHFPGVGILLDL